MEIKRTIPVIVEHDEDLISLAIEYNRFRQSISEVAYGNGTPIRAFELHHQVYYNGSGS